MGWEAKVDFVAVDMPTVNKLTVHVVAAVAEAEADAISQRTKAALAAWKARNPDRKLGAATMAPHVIEAGRRAQTERAEKRDGCLLPTVRALRDGGMTLSCIAARLTEMGITTPRGGAWSPTQVSRVLGI